MIVTFRARLCLLLTLIALSRAAGAERATTTTTTSSAQYSTMPVTSAHLGRQRASHQATNERTKVGHFLAKLLVAGSNDDDLSGESQLLWSLFNNPRHRQQRRVLDADASQTSHVESSSKFLRTHPHTTMVLLSAGVVASYTAGLLLGLVAVWFAAQCLWELCNKSSHCQTKMDPPPTRKRKRFGRILHKCKRRA